MMNKPDAQHPDYTDYLPVWQKCRDAAAGQRAIKALERQQIYLPALAGQIQDRDTAGYLSYLRRANYFNATGRTVEGMVGMAFRNDIIAEVPGQIKTWLTDITLTDETLQDLAQLLVTETILTNRPAILVEQPQAPSDQQTQAERESSGARPYLVTYKTESIINWEYKRVSNRYKLVNVWLSENYKDEAGKQKTQIRQLTLTNDLFYQQIIWRELEDKSGWTALDPITPLKNNQPITDIPFFPITSGKPTLEVSPPMIESLADINISHYMNSADIENGAHISGLPTAYITGVDGGGTYYLGSSTILTLPADAKPGFLQCGTEGFATIEKLMDRKEQQMAALGARMLSPEKKQAEAAQTHEIKRGGENAVLTNVISSVERALTAALQFAADWEGITGEIKIEINRDFFPPNFSGVDLQAWVKAWQSGAISHEYFFDAVNYYEFFKNGATYQEMKDQLDAEGPPLGMLADPSAPANDNGDA